ncbi:MAG: biopolymer transporter ExbD [Cytophagaceae bacterium]|nr:biopolymer transporter ExbD [Cytophagaceae bacterium]MDW8457263.1 biopolymer transporter ExbD [Cytophagaceae bacterium]
MSKGSSRKSVSLDMTAMCDMGFLLLTFFILTAKMKSPETVAIDTPSSISTEKLPEVQVLKITLDKSGRIFYSISDQATRLLTLDYMKEKYKVAFSDAEKARFIKLEMFGMPIAQLRPFMALSEDMKKKFQQPGIPVDSTNNELKMWIDATKRADPKCRIIVKGDRDAYYESYNKIVSTLQELNLNNFSLVTTLEVKP